MKREELIESKEGTVLKIAIRPSYANRQTEVDRMSLDIGRSYINKIFPVVEDEIEIYFRNKYFADITPYMKSGDWEKAIELLLPLTNSDNRKISKRAAWNLFAAYKALGDMKKSDYWLGKYKKK